MYAYSCRIRPCCVYVYAYSCRIMPCCVYVYAYSCRIRPCCVYVYAYSCRIRPCCVYVYAYSCTIRPCCLRPNWTYVTYFGFCLLVLFCQNRTFVWDFSLVVCVPASLNTSLGYPDFIELHMRLSVALVNMLALRQPEKWPESRIFATHSE